VHVARTTKVAKWPAKTEVSDARRWLVLDTAQHRVLGPVLRRHRALHGYPIKDSSCVTRILGHLCAEVLSQTSILVDVDKAMAPSGVFRANGVPFAQGRSPPGVSFSKYRTWSRELAPQMSRSYT